MPRATLAKSLATLQTSRIEDYADHYKMARRVGIAPTSSGFGVLCIACLPPPYLKRGRFFQGSGAQRGIGNPATRMSQLLVGMSGRRVPNGDHDLV
jgi:hypothetical protein